MCRWRACLRRNTGEEVGAFVILKEGQQLTGEEVRDFCRGRIARFKVPKYVFFLESFPITGSGKIQKFKLREMSLGLLEKYGYTRTRNRGAFGSRLAADSE